MKNSTRKSTTNEMTTTTTTTLTTTVNNNKSRFFCFHMSGQKSDERIVNDDGPLQKIFHF